ncbi:MAG: serine/threonine-protein kinase [Polyangiaceae bacterium]
MTKGAGQYPATGDVLQGKYRLEQLLGRGGMGVVFAAHHLQLDQRVALKFLNEAAASNGEAVARFLREARATVKIANDHVVRILDAGTFDSGVPYLVMEFLQGCDVDSELSRRGRFPVEEALDFVLQAGEAIAEAHALGIVHRDLKPANLFLSRRPDGSAWIKVLDFGISKLLSVGVQSQATQTATVLGSPYYMSPEQLHAARGVDARCDIWALGVVLYELLSGQRPFGGNSLFEVGLKISTEEPASLSFLGTVPVGLESVIKRCLEKDPDRRYQSVAELAQALAPWAPPRSHASIQHAATVPRSIASAGSAGRSLPSSPPPEPTNPTLEPWGQTAAAPRAKRRALVVVAALTIVAMAVVLVGRLISSPEGASAPASGAAASAVTIKSSEPSRDVSVAPPMSASVTVIEAGSDTAEAPPPAAASISRQGSRSPRNLQKKSAPVAKEPEAPVAAPVPTPSLQKKVESPSVFDVRKF